jgi:hypothetical protein
MTHATKVWNKFCQRFKVAEQSVPLFAADADGVVAHRMIGRTSRPILMRSPEMEALILTETAKLVEDWQSGTHHYDGLIYCMGWREHNQFIPLYIGKTETIGKGAGNLSANIRSLKTDKSKFARWGDNYAYHVGDLSACVLPGHADGKQTIKYQAWAEQLFENVPSSQPRLKRPIYFWAIAWDKSMIGVWEELGPTSLAFLEYLLIGVAGRVTPALLNREGVGRASDNSQATTTA